MYKCKAGGHAQNNVAASALSPDAAEKRHCDGVIYNLHPEGSSNNIREKVEKRILTRPSINYIALALHVSIPVALAALLMVYSVWLGLGCLLGYALLRSKAILIWCIHAYQRYAPEHVRLSCVFMPSCSDYMILAVQKYGLLCGIYKGVRRLKRCHLPNCGEDYP